MQRILCADEIERLQMMGRILADPVCNDYDVLLQALDCYTAVLHAALRRQMEQLTLADCQEVTARED